MNDANDMVALERAAYVAWQMARGQRWSVMEVALRVGLTRQGAEYLLKTIMRVIPITDGDDGKWGKIETMET